MKKIIGFLGKAVRFLRKAIGWPLLFWPGVFFAWLAVQIKVQDYYAVRPLLMDDMDRVLFALDIVGIVLKIWFLGYFFCVASRVAAGKEKPLYPLALRASFAMGIHVLFRLVFVCLPLFAASYVTYYYNSLDAENFFYWFSLTYILFMIVPFCLYFVSHTEPLPYLFKGTFLKSWDYCFYFTILTWFSYIFGLAFLDWAVTLMFNFVVARFDFVSILFFASVYISLFYIILFNALLLGVFSKKAVASLEKQASGAVAEKPKAVEEKQPVKEQKVAKKKITRKTMTKKTATKKVARKQVRVKKLK